jgi:hypothetical protein
VRWADTAKAMEAAAGGSAAAAAATDGSSSGEGGGGGGGSTGSGDGEGGAAAAASEATAVDVDVEAGGAPKAAGSTDQDMEGDLCAVCLCEFEDEDVCIQLPCEHLFHEACVSRWLQQDSSCPQCRFNIGPPVPLPRPGRAGGNSSAAPADPASEGVELVTLPAANGRSQTQQEPVAAEAAPAAVDV